MLQYEYNIQNKILNKKIIQIYFFHCKKFVGYVYPCNMHQVMPGRIFPLKTFVSKEINWLTSITNKLVDMLALTKTTKFM